MSLQHPRLAKLSDNSEPPKPFPVTRPSWGRARPSAKSFWALSIFKSTIAFFLAAICFTNGSAEAALSQRALKCGSNSFIVGWTCPFDRSAFRHFVMALMVSDQDSGFHVLSKLHGYPYEVVEPKRHLVGFVKYEGAKIIELHGEDAGHFGIPFVSNGRRLMLVWEILGEFTYYVGPRPLVVRSAPEHHSGRMTNPAGLHPMALKRASRALAAIKVSQRVSSSNDSANKPLRS